MASERALQLQRSASLLGLVFFDAEGIEVRIEGGDEDAAVGDGDPAEVRDGGHGCRAVVEFFAGGGVEGLQQCVAGRSFHTLLGGGWLGKNHIAREPVLRETYLSAKPRRVTSIVNVPKQDWA